MVSIKNDVITVDPYCTKSIPIKIAPKTASVSCEVVALLSSSIGSSRHQLTLSASGSHPPIKVISSTDTQSRVDCTDLGFLPVNQKLKFSLFLINSSPITRRVSITSSAVNQNFNNVVEFLPTNEVILQSNQPFELKFSVYLEDLSGGTFDPSIQQYLKFSFKVGDFKLLITHSLSFFPCPSILTINHSSIKLPLMIINQPMKTFVEVKNNTTVDQEVSIDCDAQNVTLTFDSSQFLLSANEVKTIFCTIVPIGIEFKAQILFIPKQFNNQCASKLSFFGDAIISPIEFSCIQLEFSPTVNDENLEFSKSIRVFNTSQHQINVSVVTSSQNYKFFPSTFSFKPQSCQCVLVTFKPTLQRSFSGFETAIFRVNTRDQFVDVYLPLKIDVSVEKKLDCPLDIEFSSKLSRVKKSFEVQAHCDLSDLFLSIPAITSGFEIIKTVKNSLQRDQSTVISIVFDPLIAMESNQSIAQTIYFYTKSPYQVLGCTDLNATVIPPKIIFKNSEINLGFINCNVMFEKEILLENREDENVFLSFSLSDSSDIALMNQSKLIEKSSSDSVTVSSISKRIAHDQSVVLSTSIQSSTSVICSVVLKYSIFISNLTILSGKQYFQ
ncbi:hypothetical protein GEMRC1_008953 [Eukaryota sp. GEM-RC1]